METRFNAFRLGAIKVGFSLSLLATAVGQRTAFAQEADSFDREQKSIHAQVAENPMPCPQPSERSPAALQRAIDTCSSKISSGQLSRNEMAIAYAIRGNLYFQTNKLALAESDCGMAIRTHQRETAGYYCLGLVLFARKDYDGAIAQMSKAVQVAPRNYQAIAARGIIYEVKGLRDQAISDYRRALAINSQYQMARERLERLQGRRR